VGIEITGLLTLGKRPRHEYDHAPPSSAEFKNEWSYNHTSPIRLHSTEKDNPAFYIFFTMLQETGGCVVAQAVVAGFLHRKTVLNPKPDRVRFVVDKLQLGQLLTPSISSFTCTYMSTNTLEFLIYVSRMIYNLNN
jgi:hypothetical protein